LVESWQPARDHSVSELLTLTIIQGGNVGFPETINLAIIPFNLVLFKLLLIRFGLDVDWLSCAL